MPADNQPLDLADAAQRDRSAPADDPVLVAPWNHRGTVEAVVVLNGGDHAISRTRTHIEQLKPDDDPPWLYWMDPAATAASAGACFLELDQADQAVALLSEGIDQYNESFVRDQQSFTILLAHARALSGKQCDLDAAAGLGMESIDSTESLDSNRVVDRLRDLCCQLNPHANVPAVRDFLERAREFAQL